MKFNWGHGIALFFSCFVGFMVFLAVKSHSVNIDLEADDYYARELTYQSHIEKQHNAARLSAAPAVQQKGDRLIVTFPKDGSPDRGNMLLFRPSDKQYDRGADLKLSGSTVHSLDIKGLPAGHYRLQLDWVSGQTPYYSELTITLK